MNHLRILRILDWISVAMLGLVALVVLGTVAFTVWVVQQAGEAAVAVLPPVLLIHGVTVVILLAMIVPLARAANGLEKGRGRLAQSLVAVLSMLGVPMGTAFGVYSLWALWVNPDTKARFEGERDNWALWVGLGLVPVVLMVGLVAVSVPPLFPLDLEAVDARWEPLADRTQRVEHAGCSLLEVRTDAGCTPATPTGVRTEEIAFPVRVQTLGFTDLRGTVNIPEGLSEPRPAVVFVHGSGPQDRSGAVPGEIAHSVYAEPVPVFEVLADELASRGLVVLRYDKRSCASCYPEIYGQDDLDMSVFRFQDLIDDAQAGADFLAGLPEVDPERLVVIGHSQGASLAPHIAATDDRFAAVVMLAGFTGSFSATLTEQLDGLAELRMARYDLLTTWIVRAQARGYQDCTGRLAGDYDPSDGCLGGGVTLQALAEYDELSLATVPTVAALDVPLMAIAGTVDLNVPPEHLHALRDASHGDAEFHLVPWMGHALRDLQDPSVAALHPELVDRLVAFLDSVRTSPEAE